MSFSYKLPSETDFLSTIIELLESSEEADLIKKMSNASCVFKPSNDNGIRWHSLYLDIDFKIATTNLLKISDEDKNKIKELCESVLDSDIGYDILDIKFTSQMTSREQSEIISVEAHFEKQKAIIIEQINKAKFTIWIAVAWFTEPDIFQTLKDKYEQGVCIRLIVLDDQINQEYGYQYEDCMHTKRFEKYGGIYKNIMHNKFFIVDLEVVVEGSYNWSKKAEYNKETVLVHINRDLAKKFSEEFIKLWIE